MEEQDQENPYAAPAPTSQVLSPRLSLTLGVVLLAVIVIAFLLNVALGFGVVLVAIPAYIRAVRLSSVRVDEGRELSKMDRLMGFLGSLGIVIGCAIAGAIAFMGTCTGLVVSGVIESDSGAMLTIVLSVAGFLFAAGLLYRLAWPPKPRPPSK